MRVSGGRLSVAPETFYKRSLPPNCVAFSSAEGRTLFREALSSGTMEGYFPLAEHFRTQLEPAYCGLGSLVMALNVLGTDPRRVWKGPWRWIEEETLECCSPLEMIQKHGTTMAEFSCLASCNGAVVSTKYAAEYGEADLRRDVATVMRSPDAHQVLVASYDRQGLGQTGTGHFSPIGGYHEARDLVLIMDIARFKYPSHWVSMKELYRAMVPKDPMTDKSRGWHLLSRRKARLSMIHFLGHLASGRWLEMVARLKSTAAKGSDALLEELVASSQNAEVFPRLVEGAEKDRWHIVSKIRRLESYKQLPSHLREDIRLVIALLHESMVEGGKTQKHADDKPFQLELRAIGNVIESNHEFFESMECATCHDHGSHHNHHHHH